MTAGQPAKRCGGQQGQRYGNEVIAGFPWYILMQVPYEEKAVDTVRHVNLNAP